MRVYAHFIATLFRFARESWFEISSSKIDWEKKIIKLFQHDKLYSTIDLRSCVKPITTKKLQLNDNSVFFSLPVADEWFFDAFETKWMDNTSDEIFLALRQFGASEKLISLSWKFDDAWEHIWTEIHTQTQMYSNSTDAFHFAERKIKWSNTLYGTESSTVFNGINLLHKICRSTISIWFSSIWCKSARARTHTLNHSLTDKNSAHTISQFGRLITRARARKCSYSFNG